MKRKTNAELLEMFNKEVALNTQLELKLQASEKLLKRINEANMNCAKKNVALEGLLEQKEKEILDAVTNLAMVEIALEHHKKQKEVGIKLLEVVSISLILSLALNIWLFLW